MTEVFGQVTTPAPFFVGAFNGSTSVATTELEKLSTTELEKLSYGNSYPGYFCNLPLWLARSA